MLSKIKLVTLALVFFNSTGWAEDVRIFYSGQKVSRGTTTAKIGDRVTLYNQSQIPHAFESVKPGFEFKTPMLKYQQSYTVVFFKSGVTTIACPDHPDTKMTLIIQAAPNE